MQETDTKEKVQYAEQKATGLRVIIKHPTLGYELENGRLRLTVAGTSVQAVANNPQARKAVADYGAQLGLPEGSFHGQGEGPIPLDAKMGVISGDLKGVPAYWAYTYELWKSL